MHFGRKNEQNMTLMFKVVLLGDSEVGKTSLLRRLLGEQFDPTFIASTPGGHETVKTKLIKVQGNKVQLEIWDSPGSELFRTVSAAYLTNVKCVLMFFDVSREETFRNVTNWVSVVDCHTTGVGHGIPKIIIGNKTDKTSCVPREEAMHMAEKNDAKYYETSAKTQSCDEIEQLFETIITDFVETLPNLAKKEETKSHPKDSTWHKRCTIL